MGASNTQGIWPGEALGLLVFMGEDERVFLPNEPNWDMVELLCIQCKMAKVQWGTNPKRSQK